MGWLGVGRPEQPRKSSSRREERHDQREAMRASRDSNTWGQQQGMASPVGSTTGTHHPHGERPHLGTSSSRRVSHTRTSSRGRSQQPSPLTSPRQQSSVSHPYGNNNGYGGSYQQQPSYAQHSMQQQQHIQTQDSSGSAYGAQGAPGPGSQGGMLDRVRQAVQTFAGGGGSSGGVGAGGSGQLRSGSKGAPGQQQQQQQQHLQESASAAAAAEQVCHPGQADALRVSAGEQGPHWPGHRRCVPGRAHSAGVRVTRGRRGRWVCASTPAPEQGVASLGPLPYTAWLAAGARAAAPHPVHGGSGE